MCSDPGCSGTEASRSARPSPFTKPRGAGSPFQPVLFGHTSYPGRGTDPHPRQPRPRTSSRGNRRAGPGNRAGSRRGPKAAKEEAAPGAAMAEGRGSSRLYSLRLISLGLRLTASLPGELQNAKELAPDTPRPRVQTTPAERQPQHLHPGPGRPAPARWLRRRRPRPAPARTRSAPPPSSAAMLTPAGAGAEGVRRPFPAR